MLYDAIESLNTSPLWLAALWVTLANVAMFVMTLVAGEFLLRRFSGNRVTPLPKPLTRAELWLALACVALNALVAVAGVVLWRGDVIDLRPYGDYSALTVLQDTVVLFVAMDFAMYVFHRVAHHPLLYPIAHKTHHFYENPRPLTLFVLNPIEVLGFGVLWLLVIALYTSSVEGILIYLALNVVFGLVGHLGVEPAPEVWIRVPLLRYVSTSTFHAEHHMDRYHNFGFYLLIWDRLFSTLSPDYVADFSRSNRDAVTSSLP